MDHTDSIEAILGRLDANPGAGLDAAEAARRLARDGPNELPEERPPSMVRLFLRQFQNVLLWVLFGAIFLSLFLGHKIEAAAIGLISAFSVGLGFLQEYRAQGAIRSLRALSAPRATVVRGGVPTPVASREVVRGDILVLAAGDRVAADARLVESARLEVAEASLTGESMPVEKRPEPSLPADTPLGDRRNMVHATTFVTAGRARAVVTATGAATEVGAIGRLLEGVKPRATPLERQLARFARWLILAAGAVVAIILAAGLARGHPVAEMVLFAVALAVAVVPEALPAVVTISLAVGAQRMARRRAIVRRLPVVETLGSTTVICSDKTGTLTKGEMTVTNVLLPGYTGEVTGSGYDPHGEVRPTPDESAASGLREAALAFALCNDAELHEVAGRWEARGDPTEAALVAFAKKVGVEASEARREWPRVGEEPFSPERKTMTTFHVRAGERVGFAKGAPESLLSTATRRWGLAGIGPMTDEDRRALVSQAEALAAQGMRVLAVSAKKGPDGAPAEEVFLAMVGMRDPPRPEARAAIATCHAAGIRPVLITGDHPSTAKAVAADLGLRTQARVVTGRDLDAMDPLAVRETVLDCDVYARVSPANKLAIVAALQLNHEIVAMTGDGVNDAPALRKADIGVAMGVTGTDVAKEAAAMMLADDNFATIVGAVEEGRTIFDNVRKYLVYLMSTNFGEVALIGATMLLGLPLPLTAVMILYVNLASDGLPALALAVDPHERDVMLRPPRKPGRPMLDGRILGLMLVGGLYSAAANVAVFAWALASGRPLAEAMTTTFVSLVLIQFTKAYVFRSERRGIWVRPFENRWLNWAVLWEVSLLLVLIYVPPVRVLFGTVPLSLLDWAAIGAVALSVIPVLEPIKWWIRAAERRTARA
ncbi:MAG: HAD-IC family P-type ATPase [Euryarchaeota archaeon]|nr:HAD-IC family P-type ATPase [Euryarchaeota archaeon]